MTLRAGFLGVLLSCAVPISLASLATFATSDARASVSIAVAFDPLVLGSDAVAIVTPVEQNSVWEDGRIYTYTRAHADTSVAGHVNGGDDVWVRTLGGIVGHIGQSVSGEAVLTVGRPSLLFLAQGPASVFEVTARAQGQFPIRLDETTKTQKLVRSSAVGVLLPPHPALQATVKPAENAAAGQAAVKPKSVAPATGQTAVKPVMASDVLHDKRVDEAVKEIAAAWKRLHAK